MGGWLLVGISLYLGINCVALLMDRSYHTVAQEDWRLYVGDTPGLLVGRGTPASASFIVRDRLASPNSLRLSLISNAVAFDSL